MAISKDNKILKAAVICLNINASEVDKLIEKKNEFCKDDNFGLSWVLSQVIKTSQPSLLGTTEEEEILVRQWLEYASTHLSHLDDMSLNDTFSTFKELNEVLSDRVFLVGNKLTLADLIFYFMVYISFIKKSTSTYPDGLIISSKTDELDNPIPSWSSAGISFLRRTFFAE